MLSVANAKEISEERKMPSKDKELKVKVLSHAEAKSLQEAARVKYKKAFDALKDM